MAGETYDYTKACRVLNEADKNRILCCYLHASETIGSNVNWQAASDAFGSASTASFKKMVSNALKKVKDAEDLDEDAVAATEAKAKGSKSAASVSKKRKAPVAEGDGSAEPVVATPTSKKKGRKAKNLVVAQDEDQQQLRVLLPAPVKAEVVAEAEDTMFETPAGEQS